MFYIDKRTGSRISVDESNLNLVAYMTRSDAYKLDADFKEEQHPRDEDGKFASGNGSVGASEAPEATTDYSSKYTLSSAKEISADLKQRFNISFENGTNRGSKTSEPNYSLNRKQYNVDSKASGAVKTKQLAGHVYGVLDEMESRGFNLKKVLEKRNVAFSASEPASKNAAGSSWQVDGKGYVALSHDLLNKDFVANTVESNRQRQLETLKHWSVSGQTGDDYVRSTIAHELAHAIGDNEKPPAEDRLLDILMKLQAQGEIGYQEPEEEYSDAMYDDLMDWISYNISEYASTSLSETHAELCAYVTAPNYKQGTLPKELEDYVYELFGKE